MKKLLALSILICSFATFFTGCQSSDKSKTEGKTEDKVESKTASEAEPKKETKTKNEEITIAFLPNEDESAERSKNAFKMLQDEVTVALGEGYTVKTVVLDDYNAVSEAILTGTAQIAWESGATFVATHLKDDKVIPILSYGPGGDTEKAGYSAYIATNIANKGDFEGKERDERLKQLKGKSFSFVSPTSTSGCLVPTTTFFKLFGPEGEDIVENRQLISDANDSNGGIFSEVQMGGNHPGSVNLIATNKVYAGAYCCNYGDDFLDQLYIIDTEFVPNGPMWVNSETLGQENIDKIVKHFVNLTPETALDDQFFEVPDGFFYEAKEDEDGYKFFETDLKRYQFIIDMYKDK